MCFNHFTPPRPLYIRSFPPHPQSHSHTKSQHNLLLSISLSLCNHKQTLELGECDNGEKREANETEVSSKEMELIWEQAEPSQQQSQRR